MNHLNPMRSTPRPAPPWAARSRVLLALVVILALLPLLACGGRSEPVKETEEALKAAIETYLPALEEAYSSGKVEPLKQYASERETNKVFTRAQEQANEGRVLEATFHNLTLEEVQFWGRGNANATTVEIWDLRLFTAGSHQLISQDLNQASRVKYYLKWQDDRWVIFNRELDQKLG